MTVAGAPDTNTIILDVLIHITNIWPVYQLYQRGYYIEQIFKQGKQKYICLAYIEWILPLNEILTVKGFLGIKDPRFLIREVHAQVDEEW